MAPIAITTSLTSPPGLPLKQSALASQTKDQGIALDQDGSSTPYSTTSTAVSESGEDKFSKTAYPSPLSSPKVTLNEILPKVEHGSPDYYSRLLASSAPTPATRSGTTVYGSAIDVLEALAVKYSESVWLYDDAIQVGFGSRLPSWNLPSVHSVQTRQGAGMELAGYARKSTGRLSVFATTATLPYLLPNLKSIEGNVVIHLGTTEPDADLALEDSLSGEIIRSLSGLPEGWETIFSSLDTVDSAAGIYAREGKTIHVVESTAAAREVSSYTFPAPSTGSIDDFSISNASASEVVLTINGRLSSTVPSTQGSVVLNTLTPSPDALFAAVSGKTVTVLGSTKAETDALRTIVLSALYSASGSSKASFPVIKSSIASASAPLAENAKSITFFTGPVTPLPELLSHLFLSSPSLSTRLAQFGSASARGLKSVLSLSPSTSTTRTISPNTSSYVTWVSDANVFKSTNVLANAAQGGILVLELPWTEEEVPVKLSRSEIETIQSKQLRVFLLDLDPSASTLPTKEQIAFLLLYTGSQRLPAGIRKVLDVFHGGDLGREDIEDAQAGLLELEVSSWIVPELEEGKEDRAKPVWEWDALPGQAGIVSLEDDAKPQLGAYDLAARHLLFREAYTVDYDSAESRASLDALSGPVISALRPSESEKTYLATVSETRRLTPMTYDRNVFHLELDTAGTGLTYELGEAIGIHGWNDTAEVLDFCSWYGLEPDALVSFPSPIQDGTMETRTVIQLLQQNLDLFGRPGKAFYAALAKLATSKADAMTLKFISAPEGAELFKKMAEKETVTFADVLFKFRTARPSIEELVGLIPEIKPRHYSIASSQKAIGDKVELLIVTVDWVNSKGSPRYGQCTRYLAALQPGDKVTVSIKPSVMKLPPHDTQPIIMSGLGTGAAPFRAFMQHRAWQKAQGIEVGPLLYYFGSRHRSQEYLYGEEIEAYLASGIISHAGLAFSRDGPKKVYIQHKISEDAAMLADLLSATGDRAAYFYLCGPTWPVPDVYEALVGSLQSQKGMEKEQAEGFIESLKEQERYVLEVY